MEYRITITLPLEPYIWEAAIVAALRAGKPRVDARRKELGLSFTGFNVGVEEGQPS
jgi:hypothetical protein